MAKRKSKKIRYDRLIVLIIAAALLFYALTQMLSCAQNHFFSDDEEKSKSKAESVYLPENNSSEASADDYAFTVVIDAGHGGDDVGAVDFNGTRYEKDDVLDVALLVREELSEYGNINVVMTRDDDTFVSLDDRCKIANDMNADLFVSIHRNSADIGNGVEIWVNSENNSDDKLLAQKILSKFSAHTVSQIRGTKEGYRDDSGNAHNYYVNSNTNMPSCLIELGFITDSNDNNYFDLYKADYAKAIADGIIDAAQVLELYP